MPALLKSRSSRPKCSRTCANRRADVIGIADIGRDGEHPAARGLRLGGRLLQFGGAASGQDDGVSGAVEGEGDGAADAAAGAGDESDLSVGSHVLVTSHCA